MSGRIHLRGIIALGAIYALLVAFAIAVVVYGGGTAAVAASLPMVAVTKFDESDFIEPFDAPDDRYADIEEDGECVIYDRDDNQRWISSTVHVDARRVA